MRRMTNEIVWAGVAAIVCGIAIASLLGGTKTPWWLVLVTIGAGLVVTIVRSRLTNRDGGTAYAPPPVTGEPEPEPGAEPTRERRPVETGSPSAGLRARDAASLRRAGARSESLRTGPAPRRRDDPSK
jgi:hypothetical protein